ncbi:MAG: hypothetical protein SGARI_002283 [Bacillariaceae sp.]
MEVEKKALDWDAEDDCSVDREDSSLVQRQAAYYAKLAEQGKIGKGFFDQNLENLHVGIDVAAENAYYTEPKSLSLIESDVTLTPHQHPLRAIASILHNAPDNSTIRVSAYRLTDLAAIDLLVRAGARRAALLEHVEIRLANISGAPCESTKLSMHMKSIITDTHATFGSYSLTAFARVANWEELCVIQTTETQTARFDALWENLPSRAAENFYSCLQNVPPGSRRQARIQQRNAAVSEQELERHRQRQAADKQANRQQRELEES